MSYNPEYKIITGDAFKHELHIEYTITPKEDEEIIQIPLWRPGRYEAGNFARKYIGFSAYQNSEEVKSLKQTSNTWKVYCKPNVRLSIRYSYYGDELTAGNTFFDDYILLINPVNSLIYVLGAENEQGSIQIRFPAAWSWACGLDENIPADKGLIGFGFSGVQEIMDSPILCSNHLQTFEYEINGVHFYAHFAGEPNLHVDRMEADFRKFTQAQIDAFGDFPVERYHFLNILLPYKAYHGVEHENNTVIIFGPSNSLEDRSAYLNFLGVSSHELYHTWNVKNIRPKSWNPYNFQLLGHSRLAYVAEGVTTYMGDYMLWESGVFSDSDFLNELETILNRHLLNEGRNNLSLADSSIDTWVDGYGRTSPGRRISIYNEGAMLALITDAWLRQYSDHRETISSFMRKLFHEKGDKKGYTEHEYWALLKSTVKAPWDELFKDCVEGRGKLQDHFTKSLEFLGIEINESGKQKIWETYWGIVLIEQGSSMQILYVDPGSPAENAGLWYYDRILTINGKEAASYLEEIDQIPLECDIRVLSGNRERSLKLSKSVYELSIKAELTLKAQSDQFAKWKVPFM